MKNFKQDRTNNLYNREAVVCGGVCKGRKAWILPGKRITTSRKEAERCLKIIEKCILYSIRKAMML